MNIRLGSSYSAYTAKSENTNRLTENLLLENHKKSKAKYEIKKENGYIRHYVTKANGEVIMIKETKLPKSVENEHSTGEIKDMLMQQLTKMLDKEQFSTLTKTGLAGQREKQLQKYVTGI